MEQSLDTKRLCVCTLRVEGVSKRLKERDGSYNCRVSVRDSTHLADFHDLQ
jgi:hypothetical protein